MLQGDSDKAKCSRSANRLLDQESAADQQGRSSSIISATTAPRQFSLLRGQMDQELYKDDDVHREPHLLTKDLSILNCALFFARVAGRQVRVLTADKNMAVSCRFNDVWTKHPAEISSMEDFDFDF